MSTKAARGTKRTCQNAQCGSRFYDLNRDPIICPICESEYVIASAPASAAQMAADERARKGAKPEALQPDEVAAPEGAEELVDVEGAEEPVAEAADETFLEEEEEGGDVAGLIDDVPEGEEEA